MRRLYAFAFEIGFVVGGLISPPMVSGECPANAALALARVCVSEAGWACWERGDGYAIHYATIVRAERGRRSVGEELCRYSPRATGVARVSDERLGWVQELNEEGTQPSRWPVRRGHPEWEGYRERWWAVLRRAREVIGWGRREHEGMRVCRGVVSDWGSQRLVVGRGMQRVLCGCSRNRFYYRW